MILATTASSGEREASLVVGPDLKVRWVSPGWNQSGRRMGGRRIDEVFPDSDLHAALLDVFASGQGSDGVLVPLAVGDRYLLASVRPLPEKARKPKKVLVSVRLMEGRVVAEEDGSIIEVNEQAAQAMGKKVEELIGQSLWSLEKLCDPADRRAILETLERRRSCYLGRFAVERGNCQLECEGALVQVQP